MKRYQEYLCLLCIGCLMFACLATANIYPGLSVTMLAVAVFGCFALTFAPLETLK
jgi:hypothetical protein